MGIETRIKVIRKHLNLTQTEFGEVFGVSRNVINSYERGVVVPPPLFTQSLCAKYNIDPNWLTQGIGNMTIERDSDDEISDFLSSIIDDDDESIRKRFILALSKFSGDDWKTVEKFINNFTQKEKDDH